MQIIAGEKKGHKLYGPGPDEIRPIRHLVRKALFDILCQVVPESRFLDLFAGTGSVGLEALSRGADHVTFVDSFSEATKLINKNVERLDYTDSTKVCRLETEEALDKFDQRDRRFDLVFLGPPYDQGLARKTLNQLAWTKVARKGSLVAAEVFSKNELDDRYERLVKIKESEYGQNKLVFYRRED